jgi:aminopeptidase N
MTVHQLRLAVGDRDFFRILRGWARKNADGNVSTDDFVAYAERVSGEELTELFDEWLFATTKPGAVATTMSSFRAASSFGQANFGPWTLKLRLRVGRH